MRYVNCKKHKFHNCQATEYVYELEDERYQIEFWSYSTPMIVKVDGRTFRNNGYYSVTTAKQVSQYCAEEGINWDRAELRTEDELRSMCM